MATTVPQLLDPFGRPVSASERPPQERLAVASVRDTWYTYPAHGLTPDRLATILREADGGDPARQAELFGEMLEKDAKLASLLQMRVLAVQGLPWTIEPADASPEARRAANLARETLAALDLSGPFAALLQAIPYGYAACEILWRLDGARLAIQALEPVEPRRLTWLPRGGLPLPAVPRLVTDAEPIFGQELPPWKFVVHQYRARSGSPTRAGLLRTLCWLYLFKHYTYKDWVAFCEVYGMPLRLGKYQPGASQEDRDALLAAVRAIGHDAAGIISASTEIEFVNAAQRQGPDLYKELIELCNKEMALAVLGQTLTSEVGTVGSLAAAKVHQEVRADLVRADAQALAATLTQQVIRPLIGFNLGWEVPTPRVVFQVEEPEDLEAQSKILVNLVEAGFGPTIPLQYANQKFGIPLPAEGEPTLGDRPAASSAPRAALKTLPLAQPVTGQSSRLTSDDTLAAAEMLTDHLTDEEWSRVMVPLLDPIHRLAQEARSLDEFRARLAAAYRQADPELLARAEMLAMQWGWLSASAPTGEGGTH